MAKSVPKTVLPADQDRRERFVFEHDRNFSVIAPAGVGKTRALVDRVIAIAGSGYERARALLPKLVVVTYTNKAAEEMHQRARNALIERGASLDILGQFNRAFFGTIHSFCLNLLRIHGHYLGLPARLEIPTDEEALWHEFLQQVTTLGASLPPEARAWYFRSHSVKDVAKLGRTARASAPVDAATLGPFPMPDPEPLLSFSPTKQSEKSIRRAQKRLDEWLEVSKLGSGFVPLPDCTQGGEKFKELWHSTFKEPRRWLARCAWIMCQDLAREYRDFRLARGQLTFDDQVDLARELLQHEIAGPLLRAEGYRVILDEAQDTDPVQFELLLELVRPPDATGAFMDDGTAPPRDGHFCMVGDPQQSIYSDRADLEHYQQVRSKLVSAGAVEELTFDVTFRCEQSIVELVNTLGPALLDNQNGQAEFVKLQSRPNAGPGQVIRWTPELPEGLAPSGKKPSVNQLAEAEATQLAAWLREQGHTKLGAADWSEVALLCPRRRWFAPLQKALEHEGLRGQVHSGRKIRADNPEYAWLTALLHVAAEPDDGYEIVGVLREIFGLSDQALAEFCQGDGFRFHILSAPDSGEGPVVEALARLAEARQRALAQPLRDGVETLIAAANLRQQLCAILPDEADGVMQRLDALLVQAAAAEAGSLSLAEWAEQLRLGFEQEIEDEPIRPNTVQLITCQKAKGLQWRAVILPMLYRSISFKTSYPILMRESPGQPPRVVLDSAGLEDVKATLKRRQKQELQRLLYVALTRAQQTLVLVDDVALFGNQKQSFGELLDVQSGQRGAAWMNLATSLKSISIQQEKTAPVVMEQEAALDAAGWREAVELADRFPRRILPHALAHAPAEDEPEARLNAVERAENDLPEDAGRAYGLWWHGLMERLDWSAAPEAWQSVFERELEKAPDPERAKQEWALFQGSEVANRLRKPGLQIRTEMPFLWRKSEGECVEGLIDLAAYDPGADRWLVLDWKTNQLEPGGADALRRMYEPQIGAYRDALQAITGRPVTVGLYATTTGQWLEI